MPPNRLRHALAYGNLADRARSLSASSLLYQALTMLGFSADTPVETDEHGKPYIPGFPIHISLAHAGHYAACAVGDAPIGVDIEREGRITPAMAQRFFSPMTLANTPANCWTDTFVLLEAASKCLGTGLATPLTVLDVTPTQPVNIAKQSTGETLWGQHYTAPEGYKMGAVCKEMDGLPKTVSFLTLV